MQALFLGVSYITARWLLGVSSPRKDAHTVRLFYRYHVAESIPAKLLSLLKKVWHRVRLLWRWGSGRTSERLQQFKATLGDDAADTLASDGNP